MKNLTRWNRAGLDRFRYIDGNAKTYFDDMMVDFSTKFSINPVANFISADGQKLNSAYHTQTADWGVELLRAFARSSQVLTEHINDYANEMALSTAQQRESLVKLASMVDYKQSPPASATALFSLSVKADNQGMLAAGLQIKNRPGVAEAIFETTEPLWVCSQFNQFRPNNYNRSELPVKGNKVTLNGRVTSLFFGDLILFKNDKTENTELRLIEDVYEKEGNTVVRFQPRLSEQEGFVKGFTTVKFHPKVSQPVVGPVSSHTELSDSIYLKEPPLGLYKGDIVCLSDNKTTVYAAVRVISGKRVIFKHKQKLGRFDLSRTYLSLARELPVSSVEKRYGKVTVLKVAGEHTNLISTDIADLQWVKGEQRYTIQSGARIIGIDYHPLLTQKLKSAHAKSASENEIKAQGYSFITISHASLKRQLQNPQVILTRPATPGWKVDTFIEVKKSGEKQTLELEEVGSFTVNTDVVLYRDKQCCWGLLTNINQLGSVASLTIERWKNRGGDLFFASESYLLANFQSVCRCDGWDVNTKPLVLENIELSEGHIPREFSVGRQIVIESEGAAYPAKISALKPPRTISITPLSPVPLFSRGHTLFKGNCISAGHGKSMPPKFFSAGEHAIPSFEILLEDPLLSFISNSAFSAGVAAAIKLYVNHEKWVQVEDFYHSASHSPHYVVESNNGLGYVIRFGDGRKGKKIPTGYDNIKLVYRKGTGLRGNIKAGLLEKLAAPHALIQSVSQPFSAFGGNDVEPELSIKRSVACRISAMQRAVSADDFGKLLTTNSSVWEAKAIANTPGTSRRKKVELVVVPAGGGLLTPTLQIQLTQYLKKHAQPGIDISLTSFIELTPEIEVTLFVNSSRYSFERVAHAVREQLLTTLNIQNRRLGQALSCSQLYGLIESQVGVENSVVKLNGQSNITQWPATEKQVIFLAENGMKLTINAIEYVQ